MDIWKHGKYIDLWSVVHFLSGALLGSAFYKLGYSFSEALFLASVSLIAWEAFEWFTGIIEPGPNLVADIAIGFLGYFATAWLHYVLLVPFSLSYFSIALVATGLLALWGFLDYLKRGYR